MPSSSGRPLTIGSRAQRARAGRTFTKPSHATGSVEATTGKSLLNRIVDQAAKRAR
jgi:hypothetical protein